VIIRHVHWENEEILVFDYDLSRTLHRTWVILGAKVKKKARENVESVRMGFVLL
jgi:hypothetical protein